MKKFVIALSITALTVSAYAMSKTPADTKGCCADKPAAVKAGTCGGACAGTCGCEGKKAGKDCTCDATMKKAVEKKSAKDAGCASGVCPLKK